MAYTTATFTDLVRNADGTATMVYTYTGDAGEKAVTYSYTVNTAVMPTADWARSLAMERLAILNTNLSFYAGALAAIGTVLDTTTPLPAAAASPFGSYYAATAPFTPGATPQDVFSITGSATKIVRVTGVGINSVQTTAGINAWQLLRRSTANSGGTSVAVTRVPNDAAYPAATATVLQYTANPTAGTLMGNVWSGRIVSPAPASVASTLGMQLFFPRAIVLSGTAAVLAWNLGGIVLPAGLSVQAWVCWEESA